MMATLLFSIDAAIFVLIWLVQIIIYPSFLKTDKDLFINWHRSYTQRISGFVIPLMFSQLGLSLYLCYDEGTYLMISHLIMIGLSWISTFALSVPIHTKLEKFGYDEQVIERLINTNLPRAITWTIAFVLSSYNIFTRSF